MLMRSVKRKRPQNFRIRQRCDLLRQLVDREMKLLYKRSILGVAWTLINPLLQLAVFAFVFQLVLPVNVPHYASFVFTGLLVWNWFQSSLFQATGVIIGNAPLIRQPGFPVALLPIVTVTTGLVHFALALPALAIFLMIDGISLKATLLYLPLLQILQFAFTISLAYGLAALNVTFRDTQHTLGVLLQLLLYLTPIFYDASSVPEAYRHWYELNPMVGIVTAYRDILMKGMAPDWIALGAIAAITCLLLPLGHFYFKQQSTRFVEEI